MQIAARNGFVPMLELIKGWGGSIFTRGTKGDSLYHLAVNDPPPCVVGYISTVCIPLCCGLYIYLLTPTPYPYSCLLSFAFVIRFLSFATFFVSPFRHTTVIWRPWSGFRAVVLCRLSLTCKVISLIFISLIGDLANITSMIYFEVYQ